MILYMIEIKHGSSFIFIKEIKHLKNHNNNKK
jgi:hypothetical protein